VGDFSTVSTLPSGSLLHNRYEIKRIVGQGGVGIVYLAVDRELEDEPRAIKTIKPELLLDPRGARLIRDEAITAQRLAHPNIVRYYHYDECDGISYIVMEYVEGATLADLLAEKERLSLDEFFRIADDLCRGLAYAHEQQVIHQDIKPSNIFIDRKGIAKLADFGIARIAKDASTRLTGRMPPGTLLYMSPETLRGEQPTVASDLYSLGIVFYEMLRGNPPFVRGDIFRQHQEYPPLPLAGIPQKLNSAILRGLEKSPDLRYPSCAEYWLAISGEQAQGAHAGPPKSSRKETPPRQEVRHEAWEDSIDRKARDFGERVERWAEGFEQRATEWGKKVEGAFEGKKSRPTPFGPVEAGKEDLENHNRDRSRWNKLEGGVFLVIIGVILVLQQLGGRMSRLLEWGVIWPIFIILGGIFFFLKPKKRK
jgi:serine/threonine protein kinase